MTPKQKIWTGVGATLFVGGIIAGVILYNKNKKQEEGREGDEGSSGGVPTEKEKCNAVLAGEGRGRVTAEGAKEIDRCKKLLSTSGASNSPSVGNPQGEAVSAGQGRGFNGKTSSMYA